MKTNTSSKRNVKPNTNMCCQGKSTTNRDTPTNPVSDSILHLSIPVLGMSCGACVARVEERLSAIEGVQEVKVDLDAACTVVSVSPEGPVDQSVLRDAIHKLGYLTEAGPQKIASDVDGRTVPQRITLLAYGTLTALLAIGFYLGLITLTSDWENAQSEFASYYGWIITLAIGLGIQVGLFISLKRHMAGRHIKGAASGVAVSGGMSATAMAVCCAHYLATLLPVIGLPFLSGAIAGLAEYQEAFFLAGIISNLAGMAYLIHIMRRHGVLKFHSVVRQAI